MQSSHVTLETESSNDEAHCVAGSEPKANHRRLPRSPFQLKGAQWLGRATTVGPPVSLKGPQQQQREEGSQLCLQPSPQLGLQQDCCEQLGSC